MKKRYQDGGEVEMDPLEAANNSDEARDISESVGTGARNMDAPKATPKPRAMPKPAPKPAPKAEPKAESKAAPTDVTKLSLAERAKLSRERARSGSTTDTRSVSQRLRSAFGMKKGGEAKKMASGGMTSSASKRADGIATKGKTRGKMC